jgi:hypothetical protein
LADPLAKSARPRLFVADPSPPQGSDGWQPEAASRGTRPDSSPGHALTSFSTIRNSMMSSSVGRKRRPPRFVAPWGGAAAHPGCAFCEQRLQKHLVAARITVHGANLGAYPHAVDNGFQMCDHSRQLMSAGLRRLDGVLGLEYCARTRFGTAWQWPARSSSWISHRGMYHTGTAS